MLGGVALPDKINAEIEVLTTAGIIFSYWRILLSLHFKQQGIKHRGSVIYTCTCVTRNTILVGDIPALAESSYMCFTPVKQ